MQQFWVLPISSTMGRPAKTLLERVLAGSFRADRYGSLLAGELLPATSPFSDRRRRRIWQELRPDPSPPGWGWHPRRGSIVPGVPPGGSATLIRSEKVSTSTLRLRVPCARVMSLSAAGTSVPDTLGSSEQGARLASCDRRVKAKLEEIAGRLRILGGSGIVGLGISGVIGGRYGWQA